MAFFHHLQEPVIVPETMEEYPSYECFGYERMMPKLATEQVDVLNYFCDVGVYWVKHFDIDGWRLDVASEVSDVFWRSFRERIKAIKPSCALIGEVWESAGYWLEGSMFDSTMNYDFRRYLTRFFALEDISAATFDGMITNLRMRYRTSIAHAQLNLLDSHDVSRFYSLCDGNEQKMKMAVAFQMFCIGMPCIFYGDELGVMGVEEQDYRKPMPWDTKVHGLHGFYQAVMALRATHSCLRSGQWRTIEAPKESGYYHFTRFDENETLHIIFNRNHTSTPVPCNKILWYEGYANEVLSPYGILVYKE